MKLGPDKAVCVLGLGRSGKAAVEWLQTTGAKVTAVDGRATPELQGWADQLPAGFDCRLGERTVLTDRFDLTVVSPGVPLHQPQVVSLRARGVPVWGELELGWSAAQCPAIAITGTNGKTTTTEWVTQLLSETGRQVLSAGNIGRPLCEVLPKTSKLDAVVLEVSSFQLETIESFRASVGVLLNLAEDHLDRHGSMENYVRAKARIFENQKSFDWAIIQFEALKQLQALGVSVPGKVITFSARTHSADVYLEGNRIISRLPGVEGSVLDLAECALEGLHNAENLMAAWLVGRAMKLLPSEMIPVLQTLRTGEHRCEMVAEWEGVRFYNDSKATNVHALESALRSMPFAEAADRNVWLIAGGQGKGMDYQAAAAAVEKRVKGAWLIGASAGEIQSAWSPFAPCNLAADLIEAVAEAGRNAAPGDVVLLSPACASFDMFDSYQHRGDQFRAVVMEWVESRQGD